MLDQPIFNMLDKLMALAHENNIPRQYIIRGIALVYCGSVTWNSYQSTSVLFGSILGVLFILAYTWFDEYDFRKNIKAANARRVMNRTGPIIFLCRLFITTITVIDVYNQFKNNEFTALIIYSPAFLIFIYCFESLWPEDPPGKKFHRVAYE